MRKVARPLLAIGYWLLAILSEPQASSEIKGNPHLLKQLLIFTEVFVT
jgi:hypothetical protein